jgi:hypothetical protein
MDEKEMQRMFAALAKHGANGGAWVVGSHECSDMELAFARAEGRFFVDRDGLGYVVRPRAAHGHPAGSPLDPDSEALRRRPDQEPR